MIKDKFLQANCRESGTYRGYPVYSVYSNKLDITLTENYVNIIFVFSTGIVGLNGYNIGFVKDSFLNLNENSFALAQKGAIKEKNSKAIEKVNKNIEEVVGTEKAIKTIEYLTADEILNNVWKK